jgi:glycosyltransferase involved in cell wall biosynthesis
MHVLFVGFVWPEPSSSAAGQNILSYIEAALQNKWRVSFCSAAQQTPQTFDLLSIGVEAFSISLNCSSFNEKMIALQPAVVIFDRYLSYEQFAWRVKEAVPSSLLVLDAEDLHCLRAARHNLQKQNKTKNFIASHDITMPEHISLLHNDIAIREIACILQADITLVLSDFERNLLIEHFNVPSTQVAHIPFILAHSPSKFIDENLSFNQKHDFVFIGNFRHAPNYHAVKILAEQCWPLIYKKLSRQYPDISCHIYGAYMSPKAKQLENKKINFFVHGFASNQFSVIQQARIMLAPITFGAGVKGKLLDAMMCGTPSITTPLGQEGISGKAWPGEVVDNIEDFIEAATSLYTQEEQWNAKQKNAYDILLNEYEPVKNRSTFTQIIDAKIATLTSDRQSNFLQSLLAHHQFQSSKFMSQWIEAKNK